MNTAFHRLHQLPQLRLDEVRDRAEEAYDPDRLDALYLLQLKAAGYKESDGVPQKLGEDEPPIYPDVTTARMATGTQNHLFQDARIAAMVATSMTPDWVFAHPHPLLREFNRGFLTAAWREGNWATKCLLQGMDVSVCGFAVPHIGINEYGGVDFWRVSPTDVLGDPHHADPNEWDHCFLREHMSRATAMQRFGLTDSEAEKYSYQVEVFGTRWARRRRRTRAVPVWYYYDDSTHVALVGGIKTGIAFALDDTGQYKRLRDGVFARKVSTGPNPYGLLPTAGWTEIFLGGVRYPVSKFDFQAPIARFIEHIEEAVSQTVVNGKPVNLLSTIGLDRETITAIKQAKQLGEQGKLLLVSAIENIEKHFARIPAATIPPDWLRARDIMMAELNTATGVDDFKRGQMAPGERTAYEMRLFAESSGAQAAHMRRQFAAYLTALGMKARHVAAMYDTKPRVIEMTDGGFDTRLYPVKPLLREPMTMTVPEESLRFQSTESKRELRKREFQEIDLPLISHGAVDPIKAGYALYRDLGYADPHERGLLTPAEQQMRAMAQAKPDALPQGDTAPAA